MSLSPSYIIIIQTESVHGLKLLVKNMEFSFRWNNIYNHFVNRFRPTSVFYFLFRPKYRKKCIHLGFGEIIN